MFLLTRFLCWDFEFNSWNSHPLFVRPIKKIAVLRVFRPYLKKSAYPKVFFAIPKNKIYVLFRSAFEAKRPETFFFIVKETHRKIDKNIQYSSCKRLLAMRTNSQSKIGYEKLSDVWSFLLSVSTYYRKSRITAINISEIRLKHNRLGVPS